MNRQLVVVIGLFLLIGGALGGAAQDQCILDIVSVLEDWSSQPPATSDTKRAMAVEIASWNGTPYLYVNTGNGIKLYSLADPLHPSYLAGEDFVCKSGCMTTPIGDYDWMELNYSVCDECRYGIAHFWGSGLALIDLGSNLQPSIDTSARHYLSMNDNQGAFTFLHNGVQYLIINGLTSDNPTDFPDPVLDCDTSNMPTLYRINGIEPGDLTEIACVDPGSDLSVTNGIYLEGQESDAYVYLVDRLSLQVSIFEISGSGDSLALTYLSSPFHAHSKFGRGMRVDRDSGLLVNALNMTPTAQIWDVSLPAVPALLATLDSQLVEGSTEVKVMRAAIKYPFAWFGSIASQSTFSFNITNPNAPYLVEEDFWDPAHSWNSTTTYPYLANSDAEISPDGRALYLARYSVIEVVAIEGCMSIFSDGFESSDTTKWSATVQ